MAITFVNGSDILVSVECPPAAELIALLNTVFNLCSHHIHTLCLSQITDFTRRRLPHLLDPLFIGAVQTIGVEDLPAIGLLRLLVPLALSPSLLFLSLNGWLKQIALAFFYSFRL